jgi:predicted nucleotidyltransferase
MMIESNRDYSTEITDICKRHNVKYLGLHGSSSMSQEDGGSEEPGINLLVEFFPMDKKQHAMSYFALLKELEGLFDRSVRMVDLNQVTHPFLLQHLTNRKTDIYKAQGL